MLLPCKAFLPEYANRASLRLTCTQLDGVRAARPQGGGSATDLSQPLGETQLQATRNLQDVQPHLTSPQESNKDLLLTCISQES